MDPFDYFANWIASQLGLSGTSLLAVLIVVSMVSQFLGKRIPDDKTGALGILRDVLKAIGLYTSNRVSTGVSIADVAKELAKKGVVDHETSSSAGGFSDLADRVYHDSNSDSKPSQSRHMHEYWTGPEHSGSRRQDS